MTVVYLQQQKSRPERGACPPPRAPSGAADAATSAAAIEQSLISSRVVSKINIEELRTIQIYKTQWIEGLIEIYILIVTI